VLNKRHVALESRIDAVLTHMKREGLIDPYDNDTLRDLHITDFNAGPAADP
jgi:hypothetical protein